MKEYYECHITMTFDARLKPAQVGSREHAERQVRLSGWKFSAIDEDPDYGKGTKCYATKQFPIRKTQDEILCLLSNTAWSLEDAGCQVIREKIEIVKYDRRRKAA